MKETTSTLTKAPITVAAIVEGKGRLIASLRRCEQLKMVVLTIFILTCEASFFYWYQHITPMSFYTTTITVCILMAFYIMAVVIGRYSGELLVGILASGIFTIAPALGFRAFGIETYSNTFSFILVLFVVTALVYGVFDKAETYSQQIEEFSYISEQQFQWHCSRVLKACQEFSVCDDYRLSVSKMGRPLTVGEAVMLELKAEETIAERKYEEYKREKDVACVAVRCKLHLIANNG